MEADKSEAAILTRAFAGNEGSMARELAEHVLRLSLSDQDKQIANDLAKLAKSGCREQTAELENYCRAGRVLEHLKSKARLSLRNA